MTLTMVSATLCMAVLCLVGTLGHGTDAAALGSNQVRAGHTLPKPSLGAAGVRFPCVLVWETGHEGTGGGCALPFSLSLTHPPAGAVRAPPPSGPLVDGPRPHGGGGGPSAGGPRPLGDAIVSHMYSLICHWTERFVKRGCICTNVFTLDPLTIGHF